MMISTVLGDLAPLLDAADDAPEGLPTPCDGLDVTALRRHLLGWLAYFDAALRDPAGDGRPDPDRYDGPDDARDVVARLTTAIRSARDAATTEVTVPRLGGTLPVAVVLDLLLVETLGHGWDLARSLGRSWEPDPATCDHALAFLRGVVCPEHRGPGLPFGPEVVVDAGAAAQDRFVAFLGREPGWTAARRASRRPAPQRR